jgi:hypothetical protein
MHSSHDARHYRSVGRETAGIDSSKIVPLHQFRKSSRVQSSPSNAHSGNPRLNGLVTRHRR